MNQIQRDVTYRLDAIKLVCTQYGYSSDECQQSVKIWENQHNMNVFVSNFSNLLFWFCVVVFVFIIYKRLNKKLNNNHEK